MTTFGIFRLFSYTLNYFLRGLLEKETGMEQVQAHFPTDSKIILTVLSLPLK